MKRKELLDHLGIKGCRLGNWTRSASFIRRFGPSSQGRIREYTKEEIRAFERILAAEKELKAALLFKPQT